MKTIYPNPLFLLDYKVFQTEEEASTPLISYKGAMSHDTLGEISRAIRQHVTQINPKVARKLFAIFIEITQNIAYYSSERNRLGKNYYDVGVGTIIITEYTDYYRIIAGNVVTLKDADKIKLKVDTLKNLNREQLREYKRALRGQGEELNKGNIGLVQIILTSHNPLDIRLTPLTDGNVFYALSTTVNKQYNLAEEE